MTYVDGMVAAVANSKKYEFIKHAKISSQVFKEHGALKVVDNWGDDVPQGELTSFPLAVKCEPQETVVFSWIIWPSKEVRDSGWETVMADPRMHPDTNPMPFDGKRLIYGGFSMIVDE